MADRPILFSAPMVRALLNGSKTQTRRILKPQPFADGFYEGDIDCTFVPAPASNLSAYARFGAAAVGGGAVRTETFTPRFTAGDRLWVREAHALLPRTAYRGSIGTGTIAQREHPTDGYTAAVFREGFDRSGRPQWRPSIHMPRWASRLTLTVTDVRVERLQDISEADAQAEGVERVSDGWRDYQMRSTQCCAWPKTSFLTLWNSINGINSWSANPWVAAYTFKVEHRNIDAGAS